MARLRNLFGKLGPWAWALEPVRGCNLRCGHCATRLFPKGELSFVSKSIWVYLWEIIAAVTPRCRVEMANAGEPTLHPDLLDLLWMARKISPDSQIQITTNGTMLTKGRLTYQQLFNAGVNIVYVDMYAPRQEHLRLAEASRVRYYEYCNKPRGAPGAWTYHGPHMKLIVLMENPANWPERRKKLGRLGTFFNHLDWEAAEPFGLYPVKSPIKRRCSQPFRYVSVHNNGSYELCCQDFMGETAGKLGHVSEGIDGFMRFWFGQTMQDIRRKLIVKDRASVPYCARCNITFSKSDFRMWPNSALKHYWDGDKWIRM